MYSNAKLPTFTTAAVAVAVHMVILLWAASTCCCAFVINTVIPHHHRSLLRRRPTTTTTTTTSILRMTSNNVNWSHFDDDEWDRHYQRLKEFYHHFGHTNVEQWIKRNDPNPQNIMFRRFVQQQRLDMYNHPEYITDSRKQKLAAVGMNEIRLKPATDTSREYPVPPLYVTDPLTDQKVYASEWEQRWEDMYDRLLKFLEQQHNNGGLRFHNNVGGGGNINTYEGYQLDKRLAEWVQIQRENLQLNVVRYDRREKLQAIGVTPLVVVVGNNGGNDGGGRKEL